jgi:uncharacterized phage protein gp47/JayE
MFRAKSKQQVILEAISSLAAKSAITQLSPGGKARAIIEALGQVVGNISADASDGIMQTLLTDAAGSTLDLIAESYGVQRLSSVPPRIEDVDGNLRFYVRRGTFGDINGGQNITINRGTQIRSDSDNSGVYFIQRDDLVLNASDSETFFAADQVGTYLGSSIAPGTLTKHNFVGYADAAFAGLLISNDRGVAGRPIESDSNLRFRVRSQLTANATGNATAVRIAALAVPGVADIRILPNRAGLGTFDVVVYGISPSVSDSILTSVQARVDVVTAMGCRAIVVPPRLVGLSLTTSIRFAPGTPQSDKNQILITIESSVRDYVNNLLPGQQLSVNVLAQRVLSVSNSIVDIGTPGKPFAELLLWKQNGPNSQRFSRDLVSNYLVQEDEDLVVEPFIALPITLTEGA